MFIQMAIFILLSFFQILGLYETDGVYLTNLLSLFKRHIFKNVEKLNLNSSVKDLGGHIRSNNFDHCDVLSGMLGSEPVDDAKVVGELFAIGSGGM